MLAPFGEILDEVSEHGRHAVDGLGVVVEEDLVFFLASVLLLLVGEKSGESNWSSHRAVSCSEKLDVRAHFLEHRPGETLLGVLVGDVPELFVVFVEENDGAGGLDVEGTGSVKDGVFD